MQSHNRALRYRAVKSYIGDLHIETRRVCVRFYRAMLAEHGDEIACRLSVCLSVTLKYVFHTV